MTRPHALSILASLALLGSVPFAQDAQSKFREGLDLLKRGEDEAALVAFQDALSADPSQQAAYELWQETDSDLWLRMLSKEGQYELIAKRFMHLADLGRKERVNDEDAIRDLIGQLAADDRATRVQAERKLAADHGEYAVPFLVYKLADQGDDAGRTSALVTLPRLGGVVVPPLLEALSSSDAYLRRNVALALGYVGDSRAAGHLAALVEADEDATVREAAAQSLARCGGSAGGALDSLLALGAGLQAESPDALRPHQYSDVVWEWQGNRLAPVETPRFLYRHEMAKKAFYRALELAPSSTDALAGIARATLAERELVDEWTAAGAELGDWETRLANDDLAVAMAGSAALDAALDTALRNGDELAASGLCRTLARTANLATPSLETAMTSAGSGAVRGEAAVALAHIAVRSNGAAGADVVQALSDAAGRDVVRLVGVIDADDTRRNALVGALSSQSTSVVGWPTAGRGLASLRAVPGLDALVVADELPDLTADQVITEVRSAQRFAETPILVISDDASRAGDLFGDKAAGILGSASDVEVVTSALSGTMNRDREQANRLAGEASAAIAALASSGRTDCSLAADGLAGTLAIRPEDVATQALGALQQVGGAAHVTDVLAQLTDGGKGEGLRVAAAGALEGIFQRVGQIDAGTIQELVGMATGEEAFPVRQAAARALGALDLDPTIRAELMRSLRSGTAAEAGS